MNEHLHTVNEDLLVKYLLGEARPEEIGRIEQWLSADPANQRSFDHFRLIWDESRHLADGFTLHEEAAWQKFKQHIHQSSDNPAPLSGNPTRPHTFPSPSGHPPRIPAWLRIAASFLLVASVTGLGYLFTHRSGTTAMSMLRSHETPLTDTLPDGSVITMNRHSGISWPGTFDGSTRTVGLKGEAFFQVAPDKSRPFQVHINDITLTVLGTSFNIQDKDSVTEIVVETGLVQVANQYHTILAGAHEKIILRKNDTSTLVKKPATGELYKYYRTSAFVCDNTPLYQLVDILNEAYNAHIIIRNPDLRKLPLSTTFRNESLDHILSVIGETFSITVTKSGGQIILQ